MMLNVNAQHDVLLINNIVVKNSPPHEINNKNLKKKIIKIKNRNIISYFTCNIITLDPIYIYT